MIWFSAVADPDGPEEGAGLEDEEELGVAVLCAERPYAEPDRATPTATDRVEK
jgi:hypothetical protein